MKTLVDGFVLIDRGDGRIEIAHNGCGHPSKLLSERVYPGRWEDWMYVHGCEGGCSSEGWLDAERVYLDADELDIL